MRIATFNLESLDVPPKADQPLAVRIDVLRPELARLDADILCLQEVNGQHVPGQPERVLAALDQVLEGTSYSGFHRVTTTGSKGAGVADVHNLVTLSRWPITAYREVHHHYVPAVELPLITRNPPLAKPEPQRFERPVLLAEIALPDGNSLAVMNVHLRAPLAAAIPGQKVAPFIWKSVAGWAEGFYLSGLKRSGQALELRLLVEDLLQADVHRLVAIAGDLNCEDHETPVRLLVGAQEDTGNGALETRSLVVLDRAVSADRRWSVLHHGRPQMFDHILVSRALYGRFQSIAVHNEALGDEAVGYAKGLNAPGSYHAGVVATFR